MAAIGRRAWDVYRVLVGLIALACVVQLFLAGRGVFGISNTDFAKDSSLDPHRTLGNVIAIAAIVAFVLAVVLWELRLVASTLVLAVLAGAVQRVTATQSHAWIGGFHVLSGFAIVGIAGSLTFRAWRRQPAAEHAP